MCIFARFLCDTFPLFSVDVFMLQLYEPKGMQHWQDKGEAKNIYHVFWVQIGMQSIRKIST